MHDHVTPTARPAPRLAPSTPETLPLHDALTRAVWILESIRGIKGIQQDDLKRVIATLRPLTVNPGNRIKAIVVIDYQGTWQDVTAAFQGALTNIRETHGPEAPSLTFHGAAGSLHFEIID